MATSFGFISDAHGNPFGLSVCIERLRQENVSEIFFLGDAVGYLPMAAEVLAILRSERIPAIMGNHEAMLCGRLPLSPTRDRIYGLKRLAKQLEGSVCELAAWPTRLELEIEGRKVLLAHGSPWQELTEYIYPDMDLSRFSDLGFDAIFLGHTHLPFVQIVNDTLVVNVGSCGLPRDKGNLAACVVYDPGDNKAQIIRVPFDVEETISASQSVYPVSATVCDCLYRK